MRRITKQRHPPARPLVQWIAVIDAPFEHVFDLAQHTEQRLVPSCKGCKHFLARAGCSPRLLSPLRRYAPDKHIVELAAADRIADHVTGRPDPSHILGAFDAHRIVWPDPRRYEFDRQDGAPSD